MKKLSLVMLAVGTMFLAACSKTNSNPTPATSTLNCSTNGVYNPYGTQYPYGSQYPYGNPATTGCSGLPYGTSQYGYTNGQYGYGTSAYGSNPCAIYNNGYQVWQVAYYGGQWVCVSNY